MSVDILEVLDQSRRVGWAKFYEAEEHIQALDAALRSARAEADQLRAYMQRHEAICETFEPPNPNRLAVERLVAELDALGLPDDIGANRTIRALRDAGFKFRSMHAIEAHRVRRSR